MTEEERESQKCREASSVLEIEEDVDRSVEEIVTHMEARVLDGLYSQLMDNISVWSSTTPYKACPILSYQRTKKS